MIFLTVGTQLPFDRFVAVVDDWSAANPSVELFGQIADPGRNGHRPAHFAWKPFLDPAEFTARFRDARLILAHAGMGSIISAMTWQKPIIMMPRRADLGEQRNDHQLATAERFGTRPGVHVAMEAGEVAPLIDRVLAGLGDSGAAEPIPATAEPQLIEALQSFIHVPSAGKRR